MFTFSESVPTDFPGTTITGQTEGPVVWSTHKVADVPAALVALNRLEFWECVKTGLQLLSGIERDELIGLLGGYTQVDFDAVTERAELAEQDATEAHADLDTLAAQIAAKVLDNVIDLQAERAKRRPVETEASA
jgi:hypothetical protein